MKRVKVDVEERRTSFQAQHVSLAAGIDLFFQLTQPNLLFIDGEGEGDG